MSFDRTDVSHVSEPRDQTRSRPNIVADIVADRLVTDRTSEAHRIERRLGATDASIEL